MYLKIEKNMPQIPYERKWQFCVGSCHAATLLRADAIKQLKRVREELGIRYVRCHGIFNDDMKTLVTFDEVLGIPGSSKFKERSFYKCGLVYDNILESGMKPFVELSFMPELLAAKKEHGKGFYGSIFSMPEQLNDWAEYMQAFIRFLLHRYGQQELETWYFEVWNEPDLQGMFFQGTKEDYFQLYEATAKAVKSVCSFLKVGGPSTSGSKWIADFVTYCEEKGLPLDFVSTHQYVGDPFIGISDEGGPEGNITVTEEYNLDKVQDKMQQISQMFDALPAETPFLQILRTFMGDPTETTEMDRDIFLKNAKVVRSQAEKYPLFYTEWNLCATFSAYSNDTRKTAAYDVRTALGLDLLVDGSSIWCFSDIFEELHQFVEEFHGGFGMTSHHGIKKPVYHAMKMLADAKENRILLDKDAFTEVEAAAFTGGEELQVLLFRQNMKQLELPEEEVYLELELDLAPKKIILQRIDEAHCNPLKIWEEMGAPADLNHAEVQKIQEQSEMVSEELSFIYADGILSTSVSLGVNDVYFIRVIKNEKE